MDYLPIQTCLTDENCETDKQEKLNPSKNSLHYLFFSK